MELVFAGKDWGSVAVSRPDWREGSVRRKGERSRLFMLRVWCKSAFNGLAEVMSFESKIMKGSGSQLGGAAHTGMGAGPDNSVDRVRAAGMRYCMLGKRAPLQGLWGQYREGKSLSR